MYQPNGAINIELFYCIYKVERGVINLSKCKVELSKCDTDGVSYYTCSNVIVLVFKPRLQPSNELDRLILVIVFAEILFVVHQVQKYDGAMWRERFHGMAECIGLTTSRQTKV